MVVKCAHCFMFKKKNTEMFVVYVVIGILVHIPDKTIFATTGDFVSLGVNILYLNYVEMYLVWVIL